MLPSPLRSAWSFVGYCILAAAPMWKTVAFLGSVDLVVKYADTISGVVTSLWGTIILVVVGLALLAYANHREKSRSDDPPDALQVAQRDSERFESRLREVEQERDEAKAEIARYRAALASYEIKAFGGDPGGSVLRLEDSKRTTVNDITGINVPRLVDAKNTEDLNASRLTQIESSDPAVVREVLSKLKTADEKAIRDDVRERQEPSRESQPPVTRESDEEG